MRKNNPKNQALLDRKLDAYVLEEDEQWIEMAPISSEKQRLMYDQSANYQRLDPVDFDGPNPYVSWQDYQEYKSKKAYTQNPSIPKQSSNDMPHKIVINGNTYLHKDAIMGAQKLKSKKPQMKVTCDKCLLVQAVPANAHAFICYSCQHNQNCEPEYGIFICGHCEGKVWYVFHTSSMIKCTRCGTINKVEKHPHKKYVQNNNLPPMDLTEKDNELISEYSDIEISNRHLVKYPEF